MNLVDFNALVDDIFIRVGDPDSVGLAGEIGDTWLTCFDGDGDIDNAELQARMHDVLEELRRELARWQSAMNLAFEELENESDQEEN